MISLPSVWALVLRHFRLFMRDNNVKIAVIYWPMLDILIWGFLGSWLQNTQMDTFPHYQAVALLGILLWQVTARTATGIFRCLIEELWTRNLVNLFSLPLSLSEWVLGIILHNTIMITFILIYCVCLIMLFYPISLWFLFSAILLFAPPLFFSGLWLGFTCLQIIIYFGKRSEEFGWVIAWAFSPFSGAFYPIKVLPEWAQTVSRLLPMSYVFEGMRTYLMEYGDPTPYIVKAYILSIQYLVGAIILFMVLFNRTKQKGLTRLFN